MSSTRWIISVWIVLFFLFLPFSMEFIPNVGRRLTVIFLPFTKLISGIPDGIISETFSFSDSVHLYIQTLILLIISIPIGVYFSRKSIQKDLGSIISQIIGFIIGFFLLKYGIEKLTHLQFPEPPPNILYTPAGQLDKDIFFWTLMGTSNVYAWFMGVTEITCAIMIFYPKTRIIGAFISVGIFVNIFLLNLSFDITVKLLSFMLLTSSLHLTAPYLKSVTQVLSHKAVHKIEKHRTEILPDIWKRAIKGIAFSLILLECLIPLFDRVSNDNRIIGSYEVIQFQGNLGEIDANNVKRVHFHPGGYLITETNENKFSTLKIHYPKGSSKVKLLESGKTISIEHTGNQCFFNWTENNNGKMKCKRLDNNSLPLLQDQFHWTVESMLNHSSK